MNKYRVVFVLNNKHNNEFVYKDTRTEAETSLIEKYPTIKITKITKV